MELGAPPVALRAWVASVETGGTGKERLKG